MWTVWPFKLPLFNTLAIESRHVCRNSSIHHTMLHNMFTTILNKHFTAKVGRNIVTYSDVVDLLHQHKLWNWIFKLLIINFRYFKEHFYTIGKDRARKLKRTKIQLKLEISNSKQKHIFRTVKIKPLVTKKKR